MVQWYVEPAANQIAAANTWLGTAHQAVQQFSVGGYVNYLEANAAPARYYGSNLSRLSAVRQKYDPGRLMFSGLVPNYKASTWVPSSVEVAMDSVNLVSQLAQLISDSQLQLLNEAWTNGGGVGRPKGIVTALTGSSSIVNAGTAATISADDVYALQNGRGPRWKTNAKWLGNLAAINAIGRWRPPTGPSASRRSKRAARVTGPPGR